MCLNRFVITFIFVHIIAITVMDSSSIATASTARWVFKSRSLKRTLANKTLLILLALWYNLSKCFLHKHWSPITNTPVWTFFLNVLFLSNTCLHKHINRNNKYKNVVRSFVLRKRELYASNLWPWIYYILFIYQLQRNVISVFRHISIIFIVN